MNIKSSFDVISGKCGYWRLNMTGLSSPAKDAKKLRSRCRGDEGNPRVARVKFIISDVRRGGGVR